MTTTAEVNRNGSGAAFPLIFILSFIISTGFLSAQQEHPIDLVQEARGYLTTARQRHDRDLLDRAVETARRALEENRRFAEAHIVLGEAFLWQGTYDQAAEHLQRARNLGADDVTLSLLEGQLAVMEGRFSDAAARYGAVLRVQPYNEEAQVANALLTAVNGRFEPTERQLQRLEQRYPQNRRLLIALIEIARRRGNEAGERRYLDLALRYFDDDAAVQLLAAETAYRAGDFDSAQFHGRNAVSIAPGLKEGWLVLAESARERGDFEAARNHYQTLISIDPDDHRGWYARGVVAAEEGNRETAFQSWDRALALRPDFELALLAKEHFAMDQLPLESEIRRNLAGRYIRSGSELEERYLFRQAEQSYRRGLQLYPFQRELRLRLAELYRGRGMYGRYVQELRVIEELGEGNETVRDTLESFESLRQDSIAARWEIDQFTIERPRTVISILYGSSESLMEPNGAEETARFLESLLFSSQNIEVAGLYQRSGPSRAANFTAARRDGVDMVVSITVSMEDRRIAVFYEVLPQRGVVPIAEGSVFRSGNDRIRNAVREVARRVDELVPIQGYVVERRPSQAIIGIGGVDGLEAGDHVEIFTTPDDRPLGRAEVLQVDDLVALISWNPDGPDLLGIGDRVVFQPADESEETEQAEGESGTREVIVPEDSAPPEAASLLRRLFRLP